MSRFLRTPSLFPARFAGEPWGSAATALALAGQRFVFEGLSVDQLQSLADRYGDRFDDHSAAATTTVQIFRAPAADFVEVDTRGWEYSLDLDWSARGVAVAGLRLMALADFETRRAAIWTAVEDVAEFWGIAENVLRPLLAALLLRDGGLLVHGAAAAGILFPGMSGDGKSTIARLSIAAGVPVLSDDLNAVVSGGNGFVMLPLPFTGDLHERDLATQPQPLQAVVGLRKAGEEALEPLSLAAATSLLVRCAPYVNQDAASASLLLDRAAEIAAGLPRATLAFRADGVVWPILETLR